MVVQGQARVRRVGNGLCLPLPAREIRAEGIHAGDVVDYVVMKPKRRDPRAFGSLRKRFRGVTLQELEDLDRR